MSALYFLIAFAAFWYLSLFFQTFFQHRYAAHGAFEMSRGWEKVFYILTYIAQGSSYMSPRTYAIMHRMHHAYADTEKDPHSPSFSKNMIHMMWRTSSIYVKIFKKKILTEDRFTKNLIDWPKFDRWANSALSRITWAAVYITLFLLYAPSVWLYTLLPVVIVAGAFQGAIINWFAHKYGYINFKLSNTAQNLLFIDVLMLGECYHNNHHRHPSSINFGRRWHEIDPVYLVIRFLAWLRIIRIRSKARLSMINA